MTVLVFPQALAQGREQTLWQDLPASLYAVSLKRMQRKTQASGL